jgi:hypothetical protein
MEEHLFIFRCPIHLTRSEDVSFNCLFGEFNNSLSTLFRFQDQRCLALYIREVLGLRAYLLRTPPHRSDTSRPISSYFPALLADRGTKRQLKSISSDVS